MADIFIILLWTLVTLALAVFSIILGKRYTVAYPIAMMAMLMTVANVLANKLVVVGPFVVAGGVLVYSATFLITDLISELWGKRQAQIAVWAGFYGGIFLVLMVAIVRIWPAPLYAQEAAEAFATALALVPRIVIGSLLAYIVAQHLDVWLFHFWKKLTKGRHLWFRNNASTVVSQFVDSIIFATVAFYGVFPLGPLILGGWAVKTAIALIDTPFMYAVRALAGKVKPAGTPD